MNHSTRTSLIKALDTLNDAKKPMNRTELAVSIELSYSRTCGIINQFPEYFHTRADGYVEALVTSSELPEAQNRARATKQVRREHFENKLLEKLDNLIAAVSKVTAPVGASSDSNPDAEIVKRSRKAIKHLKKIDRWDAETAKILKEVSAEIMIYSYLLCLEDPALKGALDRIMALE